MDKVKWIIFSAVVVLILGGLVVYSRISSPSTDVSAIDANSIIGASDQNGQIGDRVYGAADSKVVLIEYGDFQCPGCGAVHPQVKVAMEEYKDRVAFVFRNFPLTTIHPNARAASAAAEAAGLQDKYWEMHDKLFEAQSDWETLTGEQRTDLFMSFASELGLDQDQFKTDLASANVNTKISFDQALGKKVGVDSTPTFFLNGEKLSDEDSSQILRGSTSVLTGLFDKELAK
jgi:protein-disulfide isomerase